MEPTMYPSRRQRKELARELKDFAFAQSPMFQEGLIQTMEASQAFEFIEKIPEESQLPGTLEFDQTRIKIGFLATRFSSESKSEPPVYSYEVVTEATQLLHPRELTISEASWRELWEKYMDDEIDAIVGDQAEGGTALEQQHASMLTGIKDDVVECLMETGAECELYQKNTLSFATCEYAIESSYERGISINNEVLESHGTHDYLDEGWEMHQTPDGPLYVPPTYAPDELSIGDEIEVREQFAGLIRAHGTDKEAAENGLLPHEHKLQEMLFALNCMRKRRIPLL